MHFASGSLLFKYK